LPDKIKLLNQKLIEVHSKEMNFRKHYIDSNGCIINMKLFNEAAPLMRPLWKERDKLQSAINRCEKLITLGEEKYVDELNKAEIMFDSKVFWSC
jgi:hypothetical protein